MNQLIFLVIGILFVGIIIVPVLATTGTETLSLWGFFDWFFDLFKQPVEIIAKPYCAEIFDEMVEFYGDITNREIKSPQETIEIINTSEKIGLDFYENRCAWSVNDWAWQSDYEEEVWKIDWEVMQQATYDYENPKTLEQIQVEENTIGTEDWKSAEYKQINQWYRDKDCEKLQNKYDEFKALEKELQVYGDEWTAIHKIKLDTGKYLYNINCNS